MRAVLSDLFYLYSPAQTPALRVGLLLDSYFLPAAFAEVIKDIQNSNFARITLLVFNEPAQSTTVAPVRRPLIVRLLRLLSNQSQRRYLAWNLYCKLDQKLAKNLPDPTALVDCSGMLEGIHQLHVAPITKGFVHRFPPEAVETLKEYNLDVLLRFGFNILRGDVLRAARYGIWSFHHDDNDHYRGGPACFWEMAEHNPLTGAMLQVLTEELDAGRALIKGLFATARGISLTQNRLQPFWGTTHFVIQKLWELHQHGWDFVESRILPAAPYKGKRKIYRTPTNHQILRWFVPELLIKSSRRLFHLPTVYHWRMGLRLNASQHLSITSEDLHNFHWIESPPGYFYADPFPVEHSGRQWVFFESWNYNQKRAVICCAEVLEDSRLGSPRLALDTGKHASYPYLFYDEDTLYMIPETLEHKAIRLYRCIEFPDHWELEKELLQGPFVDTSVLRHNGLWWLFTTVQEPRTYANISYLFFSEAITGPWRYHPENPISADVRCIRGAGTIEYRNGQLIRPVQDCSISYGYGINFMEILEINTSRYREQRIRFLQPPRHSKLFKIHTYNRSGCLEVIDGATARAEFSVMQKPKKQKSIKLNE